MQTFEALLNALPDWLLPVGWLALLLGWFLSRPATTSLFNKVMVFGFNNTTTNLVSQTAPREAASSGDSPLSKAGSWASLIGLALTLLIMLKEWLK